MDLAAETARAFRAFAARDYAGAAESARRVLQYAPDDPAALTIFGRLALVSREPDVALQVFERVLAIAPRTAATWIDKAHALVDLRRDREAIGALEQGLALEPGHAGGLLKLGETWLTLGERAKAADVFRRALAGDESLVGAYRGLSLCDDIAPGSPIEKRMSEMAERSLPSPQESALLHYTLAQLFRRVGDDRSFVHHLLAANRKQRAGISGSSKGSGKAEYAAIFERLEAAFAAGALRTAARAHEIAPAPIFILGMPRSGTTLVEQLVAASPEVIAGGELQYVRGPLRRSVERLTGHLFPTGMTGLSIQQLDEMAAPFVHRLRLLGPTARYVTDKTPDNFHVLGALRLLFPGGKVIHVSRDAMDTCFSILQQPFDERSAHACDQELLGYAYARYVRLMRHWQELFPGEFLTVEYENLVRSPADEARRIFAFCGLQWQDSFLQFQDSPHAVRTFSVTQVRQPVYRSSVGGWRRYADALQPLRNALQAELPIAKE